MATQRWRGDAPAIVQVVTITVTADDATTTYKVTMNGKVVSVLGSGTGVNPTATALQVALAASTIPEFLEVTWSVATSVVTGKAKIGGKPFTATSSVTGGTGTIGAVTITVASAGPNDWSTAGNWSTGSVPVAADDVYFEGTGLGDCLYGLAQSAVTLNSLNIAASFTGKIGLPAYNGSYYEYRPLYLQISFTTGLIGYGPGQGSPLLRLNTGTVVTTLTVYNTSASYEQGAMALQWIGVHVNNVVQILKGSVGIAKAAGEVATLGTLDVGFSTNKQSDATVFCGTGLTWTTLNQSGGQVTLNSAGTTITKTDGTITVYGTGGVTTCTIDGGSVAWNSTGTIATLNVGNAGTVDFTGDMRTKTVSACNAYKGATIKDVFKSITWMAGIVLVRCRYAEVTVDVGENRTLTIA